MGFGFGVIWGFLLFLSFGFEFGDLGLQGFGIFVFLFGWKLGLGCGVIDWGLLVYLPDSHLLRIMIFVLLRFIMFVCFLL